MSSINWNWYWRDIFLVFSIKLCIITISQILWKTIILKLKHKLLKFLISCNQLLWVGENSTVVKTATDIPSWSWYLIGICLSKYNPDYIFTSHSFLSSTFMFLLVFLVINLHMTILSIIYLNSMVIFKS